MTFTLRLLVCSAQPTLLTPRRKIARDCGDGPGGGPPTSREAAHRRGREAAGAGRAGPSATPGGRSVVDTSPSPGSAAAPAGRGPRRVRRGAPPRNAAATGRTSRRRCSSERCADNIPAHPDSVGDRRGEKEPIPVNIGHRPPACHGFPLPCNTADIAREAESHTALAQGDISGWHRVTYPYGNRHRLPAASARRTSAIHHFYCCPHHRQKLLWHLTAGFGECWACRLEQC